MKSQQAIMEEILSVSIKKATSKLSGEQLKVFEQQLDKIPKKIKQLDATPYLFVFKALIQYKDCTEFVLHQYKKMIEQKFLPIQNREVSGIVSEHLINNFREHQFMVTQVLMSITEPNIKYFIVFFSLHTEIPLPQNVLQNYRLTGFNWLSRAFRFQRGQYLPEHIELISRKIFGDNQQVFSFPTVNQSNQQLTNYVKKIINNLTFKISQSLEGSSKTVSGKFGYCFMCLQPAQYYCKDTKVPVCGAICKKQHLRELNKNPYLAQQYPQHLLEQIEELLMINVEKRNSLALSVDCLCMIYMFSEYRPKARIPYRELINSAIIEQRIWLLLACHYWKSGEMFQHIMAYSLKNRKQHIRAIGLKYFHILLESFSLDRLFTIYWNYDCKGDYRLIPVIMEALEKIDSQLEQHPGNLDNKSFLFTIKLVEIVFKGLRSNRPVASNLEDSNMIKLFNEDGLTFFQWYKDRFGQQQDYFKQLSRFVTRNQSLLNKDNLCEIVYKHEPFCRAFLRHLVQPLQYSTIDQVLRQIFYYLNVKVSDRIYRLFQLLFQVYHPPPLVPGFNSDRLFQLTYYILMLQTDLHNPSLANKKPTVEDMLKRIKSFDEELVTKRQQYLIGIYERISEESFSQEWKPIVERYRVIREGNVDYEVFDSASIIADNWEFVHKKIKEIVDCTTSESTLQIMVGVLFRCCMILKTRPTLSQYFLILLTEIQPKLKNPSQKQNLVRAILNIIQSQPNSVKYWDRIMSLALQYPQSMPLQNLVISSKQLTQNRLILFTKQLILNFPLSPDVEIYMSFLHNNKDRMLIFNDYVLKLFASEENLYIQLLVLQSCLFLSPAYFQSLNINQVNFEGNQMLFVDVLGCIAAQPDYNISEEKWNIIYKKTANFNLMQVKLMLANLYCSHRYQCPFYEAYIIQQTIKTSSSKFMEIEPKLYGNLQKFQPYLSLMRPELLSVFVTDQNFQLIMNNQKFFACINQFYRLVRIKLEKKLLNKQVIENIIFNIRSIKQKEIKQTIYYDNQDLIKLVIDVLLCQIFSPDPHQKARYCIQLFKEVIHTRLASFLQDKFQDTGLKDLTSQSLFQFDWIQYLTEKSKTQLQKGSDIKGIIKQLIEILTNHRSLFVNFNDNRELRMQLKNQFQIQNIPGFLQHQSKITKLILSFYLQLSNDTKQSNVEIFLMKILNEIHGRFKIVSDLSLRLSKGNAADDEIVRRSFTRLLLESKVIFLTVIEEIIGQKYRLNKQSSSRKHLLESTLELSQSGFFHWNGERLIIGQNSGTSKVLEFQRYLLNNLVIQN